MATKEGKTWKINFLNENLYNILFMKRLFIVLKELCEAFPVGFFFFFLEKPVLDGFTHLFK